VVAYNYAISKTSGSGDRRVSVVDLMVKAKLEKKKEKVDNIFYYGTALISVLAVTSLIISI